MHIWKTFGKAHLWGVEGYLSRVARPCFAVLWPGFYPGSGCQTRLRLLEASLAGAAPQAAAPIEFSERKW